MLLKWEQLCSAETDKNFVFCWHASCAKERKKVELILTANKERDQEHIHIEVAYCPFCGFKSAEEESRK